MNQGPFGISSPPPPAQRAVDAHLAALGEGPFGMPPVGGLAAKRTAYKTADESVSTSTTLQDDDHLVCLVKAGGRYKFRAWLPWTAGSNIPGIKLALGGTCTAASLYAQIKAADNNMAGFGLVTALGSAVGVAGAYSTDAAHIEGTIEVLAAGTLLIQWAQNVSDAAATTVKRGAILDLIEL